ncbi:MAG: hypothetical protein WBA57_25545 [Elainellaceae cyanobacterium]
MTYQEKLNPWTVQQKAPNVEDQVLARFRRRGDADAYLTLMQRERPTSMLSIIFCGNQKT